MLLSEKERIVKYNSINLAWDSISRFSFFANFHSYLLVFKKINRFSKNTFDKRYEMSILTPSPSLLGGNHVRSLAHQTQSQGKPPDEAPCQGGVSSQSQPPQEAATEHERMIDLRDQRHCLRVSRIILRGDGMVRCPSLLSLSNPLHYPTKRRGMSASF